MGKYEEALEKARAEYEKAREQGYTWLMALLEGMFPELKESEDERIRRHLIDIVETYWGTTNDPGKAADLAWLEKQKDKRELDFAEGKVEGVKQTCQEIKDAMSLFEQKDLTPFEFTFRDYIDSAIRYCLSGEGYQQYIKEWAADLLNLEKQKEQKPADKKFPPLEGLDAIKAKYYDDGFKNGFDEGVESVKPAEWSKEDEEMRINILQEIANIKDVFPKINIQPEFDWLKSLPERFNLQPKQEWRRYIWAINLRFNYDGLVRYEDNGSYEIVTAGNKPKRQVNGEYILLKDISSTD